MRRNGWYCDPRGDMPPCSRGRGNLIEQRADEQSLRGSPAGREQAISRRAPRLPRQRLAPCLLKSRIEGLLGYREGAAAAATTSRRHAGSLASNWLRNHRWAGRSSRRIDASDAATARNKYPARKATPLTGNAFPIASEEIGRAHV